MKKPAQNRLAIFQANGKQFPKTPITLLEIMREFIASNIYQWDGLIEKWLEETDKPTGTLLTKKQAAEISSIFEDVIGNQCEKMEWKTSWEKVDVIQILLDRKYAKRPLTAESLHRAFLDLKVAILNDLDDRKFVMIENSKSRFLEQSFLFGLSVSARFPSAKDEIRAAGNCLALDLNTAAIFHLMRVVESAMRVLVVHLGIKVKNKNIREAGWDELVKLIEKRLKERRQKYDDAKHKKRNEWNDLKFYGVAADELNVFKENWRDKVMHTWPSYNEHEAHGVFIRVKDFMQRLSKKVSEKNS